MISYRITSKNTPPESLDPDKEQELKVFRRVLKRAKRRFKVGDKVSFFEKTGQVLAIEHDIEDIVWEKGRPYVILAVLEDGKEFLFHPSQLKVIK